nr:MAG: hypothetical protein AM325_11685 [Candidatus Thorarchaeota archaeon SMTZ1-45]
MTEMTMRIPVVPIITDVYRLRGVSIFVVFIEVPVTSMMITLRNSRQNLQISLIHYAAILRLDVSIVFLQHPHKLHDFLPTSLKLIMWQEPQLSRSGGEAYATACRAVLLGCKSQGRLHFFSI